jgi:hypothetical protein
MLVLCVAARAGVVPLSASMAWLASTPALVALSVATVLEIAAYKVPWLDHALDTVASPAAVIAGTLITASQLGAVDVNALLNSTTGAAGAAPAPTGVGLLPDGAAAGWVTHLLPLVKWGASLILGGGAAGLMQTATVSTRATSTVATGGLLNPVIGVVQSVLSVLVSIAVVLAPIVGAVLLLGIGWCAWRVVRRVRGARRRRAVVPAA